WRKTAMPPGCPPEETLRRLLAEPLPAEAEEDLEQHLRTCGACRDAMDRLAVGLPTEALSNLRTHAPLSPQFALRLEDSLHSLLGEGGNNGAPTPPAIPGYELFEVIGRGGSSVVYRARDQRLQRTVAVKVMRENAGPVGRERFAREAKALAALQHP